MHIIDIALNPIPKQVDKYNGACEKLMIPLIAYFVSFQKLHFVVPQTRS